VGADRVAIEGRSDRRSELGDQPHAVGHAAVAERRHGADRAPELRHVELSLELRGELGVIDHELDVARARLADGDLRVTCHGDVDGAVGVVALERDVLDLRRRDVGLRDDLLDPVASASSAVRFATSCVRRDSSRPPRPSPAAMRA